VNNWISFLANGGLVNIQQILLTRGCEEYNGRLDSAELENELLKQRQELSQHFQ
jgi:hypothetical protein